MKGRRKAKKGIAKKPRVAGANDVADNVVTETAQENSGLEESENDAFDSEKEAESLLSLGTDLPEKPVTVNSGGTSGETAGQLVYRRVKVKIKTSKPLESQHNSSEAPSQSDKNKSGQLIEAEKQEALDAEMEGNANSLTETVTGIFGQPSKSPGSIKIKGFTSSSVSPSCGQTTDQKPELLCKDPRFKKQELDTALEVIKKIMKMDAAEPFNAPVDPIALGIPDYFDVIDTPMDFGTICSNLESGIKYMNSEDVYRDVQFIWNNCYKYNNKGDYILELMKRVKKNFMMYWTAAGLLCDHSEGSNSADAIQSKDVTPPSMIGKIPMKTDPVTPHTKKSQGLRKHKDGCMCAICLMIRRRKEREEIARELEVQAEGSDDCENGGKAEEQSPNGSHGGEYTSLQTDPSTEQDRDPDLEAGGDEMKLEGSGFHQTLEKAKNRKNNETIDGEHEEGEISEQVQSFQGSQGRNKHNHQQTETRAVDDVSNKAHTEENPSQHENDAAETEQHKSKETLDKHERAKMYERLGYLENSKLFELCGTLFNENNNSVWRGPHSLTPKEDSTRRSSILSAVSSFMR